jgi:dolichyl-phosphate-mannose-protein mannosyltransferase
VLRANRGWLLGAAGIVLGALALRLWGLGHGLPYVYNADENAHFVPRAIGMFGHSYNPGYFVNPPAYTYLLHAVFDLRFGGRAGVGEAMAVDRTALFETARAVAALLGTAAVALLAWAGRRLLGGAAGLIAAALLAVAFLPVHYSHLALNDAPTLAPVCLALLGVATIYRHNGYGGYALAGLALGVACATKYTAGILVLTIVAAALATPTPGPRFRGLVLAGALALAGFVVANPYSVLDLSAFREGLSHQSEASGDGGGKLGLSTESGIVYYLGTATWGLGWLPALAALGGAIGLTLRDRRLALVLVPAPLVFLAFMGTQDRFFARWLLPVYPLLCLLAAWAVVAVAVRLAPKLRLRTAHLATLLAALLCAQGLVYSVHNDVVLARDDTRQLARDWMVEHVPIRSKVVVEPFVPAAWAADAQSVREGTGNGFRWNKWPTTRAPDRDGGGVIRFEDYERYTRPALLGAYTRGGFCWVVTGSTQYGRAYAEPREVPDAIRYYAALEREGELVYSIRPDEGGTGREPFSYDFSFNAYPLKYGRMGPEVRIYRLRGDRC